MIQHPNLFERKMYFRKPLIEILGTFLFYLTKQSPIVKNNSHKSIRELLTDSFTYLNKVIRIYPAKYNAISMKDEFERNLRIMDTRFKTFMEMNIGEVYPLFNEKTGNRNDLFLVILEDALVKSIGKVFEVDLSNVIFKNRIKISYKEYFENLLEREEFLPLKESMEKHGQNIMDSHVFYDYLIELKVKHPKYKNDYIYRTFLWFYMLNTMMIYNIAIRESLFEIQFKSLIFEKMLYKEIEETKEIKFDFSIMKLFFRPVFAGFEMKFQKYKPFIKKLNSEIKIEKEK